MEHKRPHEITNRLLEARLELRDDHELDEVLMRRIEQLPEDNFCRSPREAYQLGAGFGYQQRETVFSLDAAATTFFGTQPRNKYADPLEIDLERKTITVAALQLLDGDTSQTVESQTDPNRAEALARFLEGYMTVKDYFSE